MPQKTRMKESRPPRNTRPASPRKASLHPSASPSQALFVFSCVNSPFPFCCVQYCPSSRATATLRVINSVNFLLRVTSRTRIRDNVGQYRINAYGNASSLCDGWIGEPDIFLALLRMIPSLLRRFHLPPTPQT